MTLTPISNIYIYICISFFTYTHSQSSIICLTYRLLSLLQAPRAITLYLQRLDQPPVLYLNPIYIHHNCHMPPQIEIALKRHIYSAMSPHIPICSRHIRLPFSPHGAVTTFILYIYIYNGRSGTHNGIEWNTSRRENIRKNIHDRRRRKKNHPARSDSANSIWDVYKMYKYMYKYIHIYYMC